MPKRLICLSAILAFPVLAWKAQAATVIFNSPITTGEFSDSSPWPTDGTYFFEVGTFSSGFTPTAGNTDSWLANWNIADMVESGSTTWLDDTGDLYFTGIGDYTTNAGSWAIGSPVYIWGFDTRTPGTNQWILFANSAWVTIDHTSIPPQAFATEDAGTFTIVGSMDAGGGSFVSDSIVVVPEPSGAMLVAGGLLLAALRRRHSRCRRDGGQSLPEKFQGCSV